MEDPTPLTVLVVENVEEISSQMEGLLQRKGFRVKLASDAAEAIKIAERDPPVLILTDIDLPTFNLLVRNVRAHQTLGQVAVAIIDINDPVLEPVGDVRVLRDFDQLDNLLASVRPPSIGRHAEPARERAQSYRRK